VLSVDKYFEFLEFDLKKDVILNYVWIAKYSSWNLICVRM